MGSSHENLYQELGLEYLRQRRCMGRFCLLYNFFLTGQSSHAHNMHPQMKNYHRSSNTFDVFLCKTEYFKLKLHTSFFSPYHQQME